VFGLNLSLGPTSQLGGSHHCPASETSDFSLSAKLVALLQGPLQGQGVAQVCCKVKPVCTNLPHGADWKRSFHAAHFWSATRTSERLTACLKQPGVQACVGGRAFLRPHKPHRLGLPEIGKDQELTVGMVSELGADAQGGQHKRPQRAQGKSDSKSCGSTCIIWYESRRQSMAVAVYAGFMPAIPNLPVPSLSYFSGQCPAVCAGCSVSPQKYLSSKCFKSSVSWSFGQPSFHCTVSVATVLAESSSTCSISSQEATDVLVFPCLSQVLSVML